MIVWYDSGKWAVGSRQQGPVSDRRRRAKARLTAASSAAATVQRSRRTGRRTIGAVRVLGLGAPGAWGVGGSRSGAFASPATRMTRTTTSMGAAAAASAAAEATAALG
jgi:hypothetical protein